MWILQRDGKNRNIHFRVDLHSSEDLSYSFELLFSSGSIEKTTERSGFTICILKALKVTSIVTRNFRQLNQLYKNYSEDSKHLKKTNCIFKSTFTFSLFNILFTILEKKWRKAEVKLQSYNRFLSLFLSKTVIQKIFKWLGICFLSKRSRKGSIVCLFRKMTILRPFPLQDINLGYEELDSLSMHWMQGQIEP